MPEHQTFYSYRVGDVRVSVVSDGFVVAPLVEGFVPNAPIDEVRKALNEAGLPTDTLTTTFAPLLHPVGPHQPGGAVCPQSPLVHDLPSVSRSGREYAMQSLRDARGRTHLGAGVSSSVPGTKPPRNRRQRLPAIPDQLTGFPACAYAARLHRRNPALCLFRSCCVGS